jgi:pimeloyl-[acyl-carrier protein] methyl ester esterase
MHSGMWGPVREQLARSHRVHAVDLPGHGHSAPVAPCTLDAIVAAIDAALAGEARPFAVLGWSLGGLVAMRWALTRPERVHRLALVCTTPRFVADPDWPHAMAGEAIARFGDELHVAWKLTVQRFLALQVHNSEHGRATLAAMRDALWARGEPSRSALAEMLEVLVTADLRAAAPGIEQPTLVVAGGRDTLTPPAAGRWLANAIPGAQFQEIAGSAHAAVSFPSRRIPCGAGAFPWHPLSRAFPRPTRAMSIPGRCGAHSPAPRRRMTRRCAAAGGRRTFGLAARLREDRASHDPRRWMRHRRGGGRIGGALCRRARDRPRPGAADGRGSA